jgi:carotenoid cleavage dioxygenase
MAPRDGSRAEDDGYLITFASDLGRDVSECLIFDASSPTQGPVARIRLPERISSGTHATWAPLSDP